MELDSLLADTPRLSPGRIALTDGNRSITYGQLGSVVRSEAALLRETGGLRFGLLADNGCDWAVADLAIHHLHRVNVPLPAYFTAAQMRHAIDDAGIDTLITDRRAEVLDRWPEFSVAGTLSSCGLAVLQRAADPAQRRAVPVGTTKITYTSGSTADPKGVCLPGPALDRASRAMVRITAPIGIRRHMCLMPLPTLLENLAGIHAPLRSGATCVVPSSVDTGMSYGALDPQRLLRSLTLHRPESLVLVPELLRLIVRAAQGGYALPDSLKFIAVGGAPVARTLLEEAAELGLPVFEGYGLSECGSVVCLNTPQAKRLGMWPRLAPRQPVGRQRWRAARLGLGHDWLSRRRAFRERQEIATGDLAEIDADGYVYIRGRLRNIFITSFGRNVSPEWIERELAHEPAIRHALAIGEDPNVRALVRPAKPDSSRPRSCTRSSARTNGCPTTRGYVTSCACPRHPLCRMAC